MRIDPREEPVRRLVARPAVILVYAKERLQFLASVKIRIFSGNKSIILTFFPEGEEIIPFEDKVSRASSILLILLILLTLLSCGRMLLPRRN